MLEDAFLRQVLDLLAINDWLWHHDDSSSRLIQRGTRLVRIANAKRGFPDICAARIRDGRVLFAELKRDVGGHGGTSKSRLTSDQEQWATALTHNMSRPGSTVEYHLWRPDDIERIARILA